MPLPVTEGATVIEPEGEEDDKLPCDGVPVGVLLTLGGAGVEEPLLVRVPVGEPEEDRVPEGVAVIEGVLETVADGVYVGDGEPEGEAPKDIEGVPDDDGEGVGSITPATNKGPAYMVPALVTEFHAFVVKLPAVAPVHTFMRVRMP